MSELTNISNNRRNYRRGLLTSVSAFALLGFVCAAIEPAAADEDSDHPIIWIELGGQAEQFSKADIFTAPFVGANNWQSMKLTSPAAIQTMNPYSIGGEASISFQPEGTDWVFSAGVRYGRSHGFRHEHDQPQPPKIHYHLCPSSCLHRGGYFTPTVTNYENATASSGETHAILDFQAGKDIGLGMFGKGGTSVVSAGIRFAQFSSKAAIDQHAVVKEGFFNGLPSSLPVPKYFPATHHNVYALYGHSERSFRGLGPSISWKASAPIVRTADDAGINFDWSINAALLFGRQKANVVHHTTGQYYVEKYHNGFSKGLHTLYQHAGALPPRARSVVVPNLGGMAGVSFLYSSAKVSFGYRADFFFGAMDGGLDTARNENRSFYGPFASVSIGIGG
jgi:iron complex outermembrane recepter protein